MKTLSDHFPEGQKRGKKALTRLQGAYERVFFAGGASDDDRQIVLSDLVTDTHYFFIDGANANDDDIRENQGKRSVMARIIRLGFSEKADLSQLYLAAVAETATNQKETKL